MGARTIASHNFTISKIKRLSTLQHQMTSEAGKNEGPTRCAFHAMQNGEPTTAVSNVPNVSAVEFLVEPPQDAHIDPAVASEFRTKLRYSLMELRLDLECDLALQRETLLRRSKRLVVLDMDSTLIQQ